MEQECVSCGDVFSPNPRVKKQQYCKKAVCQRARRREWQSRKMATDRDYRDNQRDAQRRWRKEHPDYWRRYRQRNKEYTRRNRELQKVRNQRRDLRESSVTEAVETIAKMDALTASQSISSGIYRLVHLDNRGIAKMDVLLAKITVLSRGDGYAGGNC